MRLSHTAIASLIAAVAVSGCGAGKTVDDAATDVRNAVDGASTTHYRGAVDYAKLAKSGPASLRKLSAQALRFSARSSVPLDVWVDGAKRVRREQIVVATKPVGQSPAQTQTVTMDFVRFGVDASAIAPPADKDVYDATDAATKAINGG